MPDPLSRYRGTKEYLLVACELITAARYRGTIRYQEVAALLGILAIGHHMAREVGQVLGEISQDEHEVGRPMLSAVAVGASGEPGEGFYTLAAQLRKLPEGAANEEKRRFWEAERAAVYAEWSHAPAPMPAGEDGVTDREQTWLDFWAVFHDRLAATPGHSFRRHRPQPQHWTSYRIDARGITLGVLGGLRDSWVGVNLWIDTDRAKEDFAALRAQREAIEAEIGLRPGEEMEWREKPAARSCEVLLVRRPWHLKDRTTWPEAVEWLVERFLKLDRVFRRRLAAL